MKDHNSSLADYMAVGAHPDDMEILAGGVFLRLNALGRKGVLVDLTDGGTGTRGSAAIRSREAAKAAKALKMQRVTLDGPDGKLRNSLEEQWKLMAVIRRFRPRIVFTHCFSEEHPDHEQAARIVKEACYRAGLSKLDCPGDPWRPKRLFHCIGMEAQTPSFCVDVTPYWEDKLRAIHCYESQVHNPKAEKFRGRTDLAKPAFLEALEVRARFWGSRIKRRYAEAFWCPEIAEVADPSSLGEERFPSTAPRQPLDKLGTAARGGGSGRRP
jgi:bacillithiol biosynthesis deacetylase BshB1